MGQADIAYMIKRIYEKYNATQEGKKYEERVYMGEDEFQYNLEEMVKKSPIDDKALLYKEIYRNISENALEIDSSGAITISPKLIIEVEKEIQLQQEREQNIKNEPQTVENNNIPEIMSVDDYEKLSDEEKDDLFVDAFGWMYETPEEAKEAGRAIEAISIDTTVNANDILERKKRGEKSDPEDVKKILGTNKAPKNPEVEKKLLELMGCLEKLSEHSKYSALFITKDGKKQINMPLINVISKNMGINGGLNENRFQYILDNFFSEQGKTLSETEKKDISAQIMGLYQDKDRFPMLIETLKVLGEGQALQRDALNGEFGDFFESIMQKNQIIAMMDEFFSRITNELDLNDTGIYPTRSNETTIKGVPKIVNEVHETFKGIKLQLQEKENISTYLGKNGDIVHNPVGQAQNGRAINVDENARGNSSGISKNMPGNEGFIGAIQRDGLKTTIMQPIVLKDQIKKAEPEESLGVDSGIDLETLDAVIDSSFGEITDGGVDMFDAMFAGMAEDLVFDGSTEVEHERDEEGEMEAGEDVPPVSAGTAPSGMVAEEVFVDETASKVNETTVPPVTNGHEVIEEPKAPEQSDAQPSLPKVITFADKIKKGLNDLGKKAKGIFGKIAGLFGGGNNDAGNNTGTTGTGGIAQDTKEPKSSQTPGQDFIQHVDLNFDYLKNNGTESRTDPIKPKGVDDQTQGFEVDDD